MCDGVLRLLVSKVKITPKRGGDDLHGPAHKFTHGSDPYDPALTGGRLSGCPYMLEGFPWAYESKKLQSGHLYVRVDMPGVPEDKFTVSVTDGRVMVTGEAPAVGHDSGGRFYRGEVAMLDTPISIPIRKIKIMAKNGVIRLTIPPV